MDKLVQLKPVEQWKQSIQAKNKI